MRKTAQALLLSFMLVMPMDLMAQAQLGACTQYEDNRGVKIRLHPRSFADKVQCPGEPNCPNKPFKIEGKENFPSEAIGPFDARNNAEKRRGNYTLGCRGWASWQFVDNAIVDVRGPDIVIFEIGNPEPFNVEISTDGKNWVYVGRAAGGTSYIDIKPYAQPGKRYQFIKLTDLTEECKNHFPQVGADIAAIATIGHSWSDSTAANILFDFAKSDLRDDGKAVLDKLLGEKNINIADVAIVGHADSIGTDDRNIPLSERRAEAVARYLVERGVVTDKQVQTSGEGARSPVAPNVSDQGRSLNRRAELKIQPVGRCE